MSKIIKVYCEGKRGSYDFEILNKIFAGLPIPVMLQPVGGKRGAKSIIQFKETFEVDKADFYLLFRDRDFDDPVPTVPELTIRDNYVYFSYRTTIENYLLDKELFYDFISRENNFKSTFTSLGDVEDLFLSAAMEIKYYQAVRHALGKLRAGATFDTTWTEKSGVLPAELTKEHCIEKALELILVANGVTRNWTPVKFEETIDEFLRKFDDDFFRRDEYLIWFQGKDMVASIKSQIPGIPFKSYFKFAINRFNYKNFPDLIQLRSIVEESM